MKGVVKRHLLGARIRKNAAEARGEGVVRTIIGPESEDTAGAQICGKPGEPVLAPGDVERRNRSARLAAGVPIDDKTYADLVAAAASVGIDAKEADALIA